ncbi:MAG: hypothetical protein LBB04_00985 [Oscillospiraceae bacterium]|nr:hypothetical protein [Oscillospiraceae bacterium]
MSNEVSVMGMEQRPLVRLKIAENSTTNGVEAASKRDNIRKTLRHA